MEKNLRRGRGNWRADRRGDDQASRMGGREKSIDSSVQMQVSERTDNPEVQSTGTTRGKVAQEESPGV